MAQIFKVNAEVSAAPSIDVVFPYVDVLEGRLILAFIKSTENYIMSSGLRRRQSSPRLNPRKPVPESAARKLHSLPTTNTYENIQVLRKSRSWPRLNPFKKIPEQAAPRRLHSWPRRNARNKIPGRLNTEFDLPKSVTILENAQESKVFLVGTDHMDVESAVDVATTIQEVQPDAVIIEVCELRISDLLLTEEESKKFLDEYKCESFMKAIKKFGFMKGVIRRLFQDLQICVGRKLGVLPGDEFRRAILEAKKIPGCAVSLGDRSVYITHERAYAALSPRQNLCYALVLLMARLVISQKGPQIILKQKDLHKGEKRRRFVFSELNEVIVNERDLILTYALQESAGCATLNPRYVVGVVGRAHVAGITRNWGKVTKEDILPLFRVPKQRSRLSSILQVIVFPAIVFIGLYGFDELMQFIGTLFF